MVQGWQGLQDEMAADMRRLWLRNLGRDDRILSDQGREARHPFLHAPLQDLVLGLPLPHLADLSQVLLPLGSALSGMPGKRCG